MVTIVQGGQYGSEAKGAVTGYLCGTEGFDYCVRTGAVNAGHTVYYKGVGYKMQQLPCGWVNANTILTIGAGAMVHKEILDAEIAMVEAATGEPVRNRLYIDHRAGVHDATHTERSAQSGRHHAIGATGKGSSEAIIDKIRGRGNGYKTVGMSDWSIGYNVIDTAEMLNDAHDQGDKILLEGTQGTLLDLNFGPYPYTTHKMTSPANWLAEAGLSPLLCTDIVMVVRTYPIRVAGNSGPMMAEISWPMLARDINDKLTSAKMTPRVREASIQAFEAAVRQCARGMLVPDGSDGLNQHKWKDRVKYRVALSELHKAALETLDDETRADLANLFEFTTVTKKLRRIARLTDESLCEAAMLVRPSRVFLTFMNYEFPTRWGAKDDYFSDEERGYIMGVEAAVEAPVTHVSYGPGPEHIVARTRG